MSRDQAEACHNPIWNDLEIDVFVIRRDRLIRWGRPADEAEAIAERLTLRDRERDDRNMCAECAWLSRAGRCLAPGLARPWEPVQKILHRCAAFKSPEGLQ